MRERERYLVTVKDWNLKKEHLYNTSNVIFLKREREREGDSLFRMPYGDESFCERRNNDCKKNKSRNKKTETLKKNYFILEF